MYNHRQKKEWHNGATNEKNVRQKTSQGYEKQAGNTKKLNDHKNAKKKVNAVKKKDFLNKMALEHKTVDAATEARPVLKNCGCCQET